MPLPDFVTTLVPLAVIGVVMSRESLAPSVRITSSLFKAVGVMAVPPEMIAAPAVLPLLRMPLTLIVAPEARVKLLFPLMFSVLTAEVV